MNLENLMILSGNYSVHSIEGLFQEGWYTSVSTTPVPAHYFPSYFSFNYILRASTSCVEFSDSSEYVQKFFSSSLCGELRDLS